MVHEPVGKGSMGIVYSGYDPFEDKPVAIKVAHHAAQDSGSARHVEQMRKMFFNEAKAAGKLSHPNILRVFDAGIDGDIYYIVTELVTGGKTLKPFCKPGNLLSSHQVVEIIFRCAKALDYAHRIGVIHRDIKPSNILVKEDMDVRIADFSIASIMQPDFDETISHRFMGSPRYMSPEQAQEEPVTNQTDLFSLGIVMYELLTGHHPFESKSFSGLIHKIINQAPPRIGKYRKKLPRVLQQIISHALEKSLSKRYRMGLNMAADLSLAFDFLETEEENISEQESFNLLRGLGFFQNFSDAELWEVLRVGTFHSTSAGSRIIVEGTMDDWFYVLLSGDVEILKEERCIGTLSAGDCFGEMSYLGKIRRSATVVAKTDIDMLKINATAIEQVSVDCQLKFNKVFIRTLIERLLLITGKYAAASK